MTFTDCIVKNVSLIVGWFLLYLFAGIPIFFGYHLNLLSEETYDTIVYIVSVICSCLWFISMVGMNFTEDAEQQLQNNIKNAIDTQDLPQEQVNALVEKTKEHLKCAVCNKLIVSDPVILQNNNNNYIIHKKCGQLSTQINFGNLKKFVIQKSSALHYQTLRVIETKRKGTSTKQIVAVDLKIVVSDVVKSIK